MAITRAVCVACRHEIDAAARVCPFCGANPQSGERIDTEALLQEVFKPRELAAHESVLQFVRQRQGAVIAIAAVLLFLIVALLHQFISQRNASDVSSAAAVPLTDVADISDDAADPAHQLPIPDVKFQDDANAHHMRTYLVEPGAVKPPEVVAAEQAAAQEALAKQQAAQQAALAKQQAAAAQHPAAAGQGVARPVAGQPVARPGVPVAQPQAARPGMPAPQPAQAVRPGMAATPTPQVARPAVPMLQPRPATTGTH
jgi:hypothetical protein